METQKWDNLEVREGLPEGRGVFSIRGDIKDTVLCNYGGVLLTYRAGMEMYKFAAFGNYLMQFTFWEKKYFYYHNEETLETYGKLINHSAIHPNCTPKVFRKEGTPVIVFLALRDISAGEELSYDYGKDYEGVEQCLTSCVTCHGKNSPAPFVLQNSVTFVTLTFYVTILFAKN
jgi:cytochrome c553